MAEIATFAVEIEVPIGNKKYGYYPQAKDYESILKFKKVDEPRFYNNNAHEKKYAEKGVIKQNKIVKMLHFEFVTREVAERKATRMAKELGGRVRSCSKVNVDDETFFQVEAMKQRIELKPPHTVYDNGNPYPNAMAMSEMPWQKKKVRKNFEKNSLDKQKRLE